MIILLILIADNTVNIYIIIWPFLKCKKYSYLHLSCHLNNLNPTQNVYLRKRLNIFTWSSRRSLIRYANSITFLCLSRMICPHCPHEWYRDGTISRLATRPQIMTQRMDKLLLHRATRRATSITVFARHARNFGHAGFPRWLHVTLMHGWARARVRARTRRNKEGYITRPRKAQKVQRSPITDATPVPPTFSSLSIGSPDVLFPPCRIPIRAPSEFVNYEQWPHGYMTATGRQIADFWKTGLRTVDACVSFRKNFYAAVAPVRTRARFRPSAAR